MLRLMQPDPDPEQEVPVMVTIVIMCIHVQAEELKEVVITILQIQDLRVRFIDQQDRTPADPYRPPLLREEAHQRTEAFVVPAVQPEVLEAQVVVHPVDLVEPPVVVEAEDKI